MSTVFHYWKKWVIVIAIALSSCNKDSNEEPAPEFLVDYEELITVPTSLIKGIIVNFTNSDFQVDVDLLQYDVTVYKIDYNTTYKGQEIIASGVVVLPNMERAKGTLSFHHGTIASNDLAPSSTSDLSSSDRFFYSAMAMTGVVISVPDYIGFGTSVDIMHPYYDEKLTASAIVDQLSASRELALIKGIDIEDDLYLAGYSQGGYATMATHKFYEEQGIPDFDLKASFPAAGGYDVVGVRDYFFSLDTYDQPFFIAYVAESYRVTYDLDDPLPLLFNEPYASRIPDLFGGDLSGTEINEQLTHVIPDLVTEDYLNNRDASKFDAINSAFEQNNLTDWKPTIDMYMYHGNADITVPYQNSVDVSNEFNSSSVTLLTLDGGDHTTSFVPYLEDVFQRLDEYIN